MGHEMKARLCTFLMVAGLALVVGGLLVLGPSRFEVTAGGIAGHCSSVFAGPHGDIGDGDDGQQARQLNELTVAPLYRSTAPSFADLCDDERNSRRTWMWVLVGVGALLIMGCGVVFWPTKSGATQPK